MTPRNGRLAMIAAAVVAVGGAGAGMVMLDSHSGGAHLSPPADVDLTAPAPAPISAPAPTPSPAPTATPAPDMPKPAASAVPAPPAPVAPAAKPAPPADAALVIKRILPIKGAIKYGKWYWDEAGVPPGQILITVDLQARVLSAWRGGYEIGTAAVLVGAPEKPTPTGIFPITQKQVQHFSNLYGEAPMPYMERLTNDGVTLHASEVLNGYASHGTVGMPLAFAKKLYGVTHLGDKVIITDGKQASMGDKLN